MFPLARYIIYRSFFVVAYKKTKTMFYGKIKGGLISIKDIHKRADKVILKSGKDGL